MTTQPTLGFMPVCGLIPADLSYVNDLLERWGHNLGRCERPFASQAWVLDLDGAPISCAVSCSTVSAMAGGYRRQELVELARLCTHPEERWATRVMLRLWREIAAPRWASWPARAAVAYSQNDRHEGRIYRFDGWTKVSDAAGSSGGGTWSKQRGAGHRAKGAKTLWLWEMR